MIIERSLTQKNEEKNNKNGIKLKLKSNLKKISLG